MGEINRLRIALPMLDMVTIGAGGGSIGWIDEGGLLRMGPQSAGVRAGPGLLRHRRRRCPPAPTPTWFWATWTRTSSPAARMPLDPDKATKAIEEKIAKPHGLRRHGGRGRHVRRHQREHGRSGARGRGQAGQDPRDFPLVVAGGAGPNHACMIALELAIPV